MTQPCDKADAEQIAVDVKAGVLALWTEKETMSERVRRALLILRSNTRQDGSVGKDMVNDAIGILEGRW